MAAESTAPRGDASLLFQIKCALDRSSVNMMISDNKLNITYINKGLQNLFREHKEKFKHLIKGFHAKQVVGLSVLDFFDNDALITDELKTISDCTTKSVSIAELDFVLRINPVYDTVANQIGLSFEWHLDGNEEKIAAIEPVEQAANGASHLDSNELKSIIKALDKVTSSLNKLTKKPNGKPTAATDPAASDSLTGIMDSISFTARQSRLCAINAEIKDSDHGARPVNSGENKMKLYAERLLNHVSDAMRLLNKQGEGTVDKTSLPLEAKKISSIVSDLTGLSKRLNTLIANE